MIDFGDGREERLDALEFEMTLKRARALKQAAGKKEDKQMSNDEKLESLFESELNKNKDLNAEAKEKKLKELKDLVIHDPQMVVCKKCGLVVGWAETKVDPFFCIPCFDKVFIIKKEEKG